MREACMRCPNCKLVGGRGTLFFPYGSGYGCEKCGCLFGPKGDIQGYEERRASGWEQMPGRRRKGPKQPMPAGLEPCPLCGAKVKPANLASHRSRCEMRRKEQMERREAKRKRRQEMEARLKAEEASRARAQGARRRSGQCAMCGKPLSFLQKLLGKDRHGGCATFTE